MTEPNINKPTSNGQLGRQAAKALFQGDDAIYDLEEFHKVFIECEDLTEYEPAMKLVGNWTEWNRLKRDWPTFATTYIKAWIEELEVLFKSRAIKQVMLQARKGNFNASRWIAEHGFDKQHGAGRPTKASQKRAAKEIAEASAETKDDQARVLRLINGTNG